MKAALVDPMGLENLKIVDLPEPVPGPGEVLVAMKAASLNYRDLIAVKGGYGSMQKQERLIPLSDGAGEIVAVGEKVRGWKVGDRVVGTFFPDWQVGPLRLESVATDLGGRMDGVACERRVFRQDAIVKLPDGLDYADGAALPCAAATAWNGLIEQGRLAPGDRVLIQGTGGVSLFALQFAVMAGAEVYAISSSAGKLELMKGMGATHLVNYREDAEWGKTIQKLSRGRGVTHAVEVVGGEQLKQTMRALGLGGYIALIGVVGGNRSELNLPVFSMGGFRMEGASAGSRASLQKLIDAMVIGKVKPVLDGQRFKLDEVKAALEYLASGKHIGKVIVDIA